MASPTPRSASLLRILNPAPELLPPAPPHNERRGSSSYHGQTSDFALRPASLWPQSASNTHNNAGPSHSPPIPRVNLLNYAPYPVPRPSIQNTPTPVYDRTKPLLMTPFVDERPPLRSMSETYETPQSVVPRRRGVSEITMSPWQTAERASTRICARQTVTLSPSPPPEIITLAGQPRQPAPRSPTPPATIITRVAVAGKPRPPSQESTFLTSSVDRQQKRRIIELEEVEEPSATKPKLIGKPREPKGSSGPNKRGGYTAKKRIEAAEMAALNDEPPKVVYGINSRPGNFREDAGFEVSILDSPTNLRREPQVTRCMSSRYKNEPDEAFPRCVSCIRRWLGDTCRFQNIRSLYRDYNGKIKGFAFTERQEPAKVPQLKFATNWNVPLEEVHIRETKKTIAVAMLPVLRQERAHMQLPNIIYRPRESEVRVTCDTCLTSIFSCSWLCRNCGREACPDCYERIHRYSTEHSAETPSDDIKMEEDKNAVTHTSPWFLACLSRVDHGAKNFSPVTRFGMAELDAAIQQMEDLLREERRSVTGTSVESKQSVLMDIEPPPSAPGLLAPHSSPKLTSSSKQTLADVALSSDSEGTLISTGDAACVFHPPRPNSDNEAPTHEIQKFEAADLTEEVFRPLWSKGVPLMVLGVGEKLKVNWSPEYFIEKYGQRDCIIIECQSERTKNVTVGNFFRTFGKYDDRKEECWKLKDWPPSTDFKTLFPELYDDFSQAVPVPNYVRRDGVLNIASHFPTNTVGPDLGPKMYNANANRDGSIHSKGSTRLHMDMADAFNIMTYAAPDPDGQPGSAVWDLFRAEDSDKLRLFLQMKYEVKGPDPIHGQTVYIDDESRRELWEQFGVKSYHVFQKAGEAVFIPAGCAHQVRNLSDCIKVAIDFVSPENVERCTKLTQEFRTMNQAKRWKEDVLQLRNMMWFAWLSCGEQEKLRAH